MLLPNRPARQATIVTVAQQSDHRRMDHSAALVLHLRESTAVSGPPWPHAIRRISVRVQRGVAASRDPPLPLARPPRPRINRWIAVQNIRKKVRSWNRLLARCARRENRRAMRRGGTLVRRVDVLELRRIYSRNPSSVKATQHDQRKLLLASDFAARATCSRPVALRGKIKVDGG
jgi:hypothetical protein